MKVLFLFSRGSLGPDDEPIGVLYLSAFLKAHGHTVDIGIEDKEDIHELVRRMQPDILAYSVITGFQNDMLALNRSVRPLVPNALSVFGGPHSTFYPETVNEEGVDGVCIGEGELAFAELLDRLEKGQSINELQSWFIKSKDTGIVHRNAVRPLIDDLDSLPFPDRELLRKYDQGRKPTMLHFMGVRGCPFSCSYCFNHAYRKLYKNDKGYVRFRSVGSIIRELQLAKASFNLKLVRFLDDTFIVNRKWLKEFSQQYKEKIGIQFQCNVRLDLVDNWTVNLLTSAGGYSVSAGLEHGNEMIREHILKRKMSNAQIVEACRIIKKAGMRLLLHNMVGVPGTSIQDDLETLDLNIMCKPDYAWVSLCAPYPQTDLGRFAQDCGEFDGAVNSLPPTYHVRTPLRLVDKHKVEHLHKLFPIVVRIPALRGVLPLILRFSDSDLLFSVLTKLHFKFKKYSYDSVIYPKQPKKVGQSQSGPSNTPG
jgi:radical SAM superfamily enzyme YgiQ (UPF0313 family)